MTEVLTFRNWDQVEERDSEYGNSSMVGNGALRADTNNVEYTDIEPVELHDSVLLESEDAVMKLTFQRPLAQCFRSLQRLTSDSVPRHSLDMSY